MAVDYSRFKAHPTTYNSIRFRSRLEATWAAFFDELGWRWEYEPFDLSGWVPDFLVHGLSRDALVEVKPITRPDAETIAKISKAANGLYNLILSGTSPIYDDKSIGQELFIYMHSSCECGVPTCRWTNRFITKIDDRYDVVFGHWPKYVGFITGADVLGVHGPGCDEMDGPTINRLWAKAKNATQWRAPR